MDIKQLRELISDGESQTLEFKVSMAQRDAGLEALCGMVNSNAAHGTVVFGVAPDGTLKGIEPGNVDTAQRSLVDQIRRRFEPTLQPTIEVQEVEGCRLLVLSADRHRETPFFEFNGRGYIREGTSTRRLSLDEKAALRKSRDRDSHPGPWRCDKCGDWVGTLVGWEISDTGMKKSYGHDCGGEFWPA